MSVYLQPDLIIQNLIRLSLHVQLNPFPSIIKWSAVLFVPVKVKKGGLSIWVVISSASVVLKSYALNNRKRENGV